MPTTWTWSRVTLQAAFGDKDSGNATAGVQVPPGSSVQRVILQGQLMGQVSIQHPAPGAQRIGALYRMRWNLDVIASGEPTRLIARRDRFSDVANTSVDQAGGTGTISVISWQWPWDWWAFDSDVRQRMPNGGTVQLSIVYDDVSGDLTNLDQPENCWTGEYDMLVLTSTPG